MRKLHLAWFSTYLLMSALILLLATITSGQNELDSSASPGVAHPRSEPIAKTAPRA